MSSNFTVKYEGYVDLAKIELYSDYPEWLLKVASAFYVMFIIVGIPGNLITIIALGCYKKYRNATAFFIINLHINDFLISCLILPFVVENCVTKHWVHGSTWCNVFGLLKYGLIATARFSVTGITINRYILLCHPLLYPRLYKGKSLIVCLASTWIAGFLLLIPTFLGRWGHFGIDSRGIACTMIPENDMESPKVGLTCFVFVCPYIIITVCYSCIWWTVKKKSMECRNYKSSALQPTTSTSETSDMNQSAPVAISSSKDDYHEQNLSIKLTSRSTQRLTTNKSQINLPTSKDKKLATMIFAILIAFAVCHLPLMLTRAISGKSLPTPIPHTLVHILEYSSVFVNPILYVILSNEYRKAYKSLFRKMKSNLTSLFKS